MTAQKTTWTPCALCDRDTIHTILHSETESEYEYRVDISYEIAECCGCKNKSFRKVIYYIEEAYQTEENEWEVPEDVYTYPSILKGHKSLKEISLAPSIVQEIYKQSISAIKEGSDILAGIGLRATIESICNEQNIKGRTLENRIDNLAKGGLISVKDSERLHAIRFMGNDAAHEITATDQKSLIIALRIIEHLIINLYILDQAAEGLLQTIIKTYDQFKTFLDKKISSFPAGEELTLGRILGKDARRFHGYLKSHEQALIAEITTGSYKSLALGKYDTTSSAKEKFQHYIVQ